MNFDDLNRLKLIIEKELKFTEDNLQDKSLNLPITFHKYLDIYTKELHILKDLQAEKNKLYGDLYHKFKFEGDYKLDSNKEIDIYVSREDVYYKKSLEYNKQEVICKFLEDSLQNIKNVGFSIKNFVEWKKFISGQ